ncbi:MAG: diadenosine tetraphosphate hydrolase [Methanomicrobiales archaeon HGW-Methanomicrobiales-6]|nr:MAG: diadenosine tetraphosphate hydrolase [Methanomicrobiales archaeon HGW-Methanomicrobiales-6]
MFGALDQMFGVRLRPNRPGHLLLIPYRHVAGLFDATEEEQIALLALVREAKTLLDEQFRPEGCNIGKIAGQTVMHPHNPCTPPGSSGAMACPCSVIPQSFPQS